MKDHRDMPYPNLILKIKYSKLHLPYYAIIPIYILLLFNLCFEIFLIKIHALLTIINGLLNLN